MKRTVISLLVFGLMLTVAAAQTKYGVTVTADKKADFARLKTYVWHAGWPTSDKTIHGLIVDAVDREMAALGFEKRAAEPADVAVAYASVRRTDVDLSSKMDEETKMRREYPVGTLVVLMRDPKSGKDFFRGRADKILDADPARVKELVESTVAEMFAKYPTRAKK